jgi:Protein of unknown function (DUF2786)/SprT-like family
VAIYSKKIIQFTAEVKRILKEVLTKEIRLKVVGDRFYDASGKFSYPIQVVIFNDRNLLGYFDPVFYELGFHSGLMDSYEGRLCDVIRHELAHYMTFIRLGEGVQPHGAEFRRFCESMGWGKEVYAATCLLEGEYHTEESSVLRKVKKLMALASSSSENEAESAMIKSRQLLLKHNLELRSLCTDEEECVVAQRVLEQKKVGGKMRAIARILQTFFVSVVFRRGADVTCLEIVGSKMNVEIALYVAHFLDQELERLWDQVWKTGRARGVVAKNSFFQGLAKGYCNKIEALKRTHEHDVTGALMVIEKQLTAMTAMVYPRLHSVKSSAGHCRKSSALGESLGKQLTIRPPISTSSDSALFLT